MNKWDERFLYLAGHIASWTKDRSRGVGAVIVGEDRRILSTGYNGFPRGVNDDIDARHERPVKYLFTEHAERNAINNAAYHGISLKGANLYVTLFPCCDCTRGVIQSGIKRIVTFEPDLNEDNARYHFEESLEMFKEANIILEMKK